ncbi:hypothetical protein [Thermodesulfobacterium thermophilum]|uniref:hypothetical protein n=1 Tax=Thermodesulfobacterium thermophilum TaxID=886 RepID=UPI0003B7B651|nr:hypothetical protein [Thermodesulfobacterium thermophilum]
MGKVNIAKKVEELQKIQDLIKNARRLVEKEIGKKVLAAFLQGDDEREIYKLIHHIVVEVYGYDRLYRMNQEKAQRMRKKKDEAQAPEEEGVAYE